MKNGLPSLALSLASALFLAIASPAAGDARPAAIVNGHAISNDEVDAAIAERLAALDEQAYALRKSALENLIAKAVQQDEAARRGISVAALRAQLSNAPVAAVADEQVEKTYAEHATAFGAMSGDEARQRIRLDLETQNRMQAFRDAVARLRDTASVEILLKEPHPPAAEGDDRAPSLGRKDAPVVITEYADYQCPYCRSVEPILRQVVAAHRGDVRLVFRQLPLDQHPLARAAAEASFCAAQQGQFWPYHDALLAAESITPALLGDTADALSLDGDAFDGCRTSAAAHQAVEDDLRAARGLGITSTPAFLVNGHLVREEPTAAALERLVARELAASTSTR